MPLFLCGKPAGSGVRMDITFTGFARRTSPSPGEVECALAPTARARRPNGHYGHYFCRIWPPHLPTPRRDGVPIDITFTGFGRRRRLLGSASRNGGGAVLPPRRGCEKRERREGRGLRIPRAHAAGLLPHALSGLHAVDGFLFAALCVLGLLCAGSVAFLTYPRFASAFSAFSA